MIMVDSSVWIAYFNGVSSAQADLLGQLLGERQIVALDLVLSEVLRGFRSDADYRKAKELMTSFRVLTSGGAEFAIRCADNYRKLRKKGLTVKSADVWIATYAIEHEIPLLHQDREFSALEPLGLMVVRA